MKKNSKQNFKTKNHMDNDVSDNYTNIVPIRSLSQFTINNAVMIAGFPGPGMIGSIVCTQLIEQLEMHQIAYVQSRYIMPGALWIGGRLRHPFRIYCNANKSVCVLTCDVPVFASAIDSISTTITNWCRKNKIEKLVALSGIYPEHIQPFPKDFTKRTSFIIEDASRLNNGIDKHRKINANQVPFFAFIGGLPGQILTNCQAQFIDCMAVLIPTLSFTPDPEGAAIVIDTLGDLIPNTKINSSQLRQEAEIIKRQLSELAKLQYRLLRDNRTDGEIRDEAEQIYK